MAAEWLATRGHTVTVYDRMPSPARKFLIAGRGGLNLTHSEPLEQFLTRYGEAAEWLAPAIRAFPPEALRQWCEGLGEETFVGSSGRVFPRNMKAVQLLRAWLERLEKLGVHYAPRHSWRGWKDGALTFYDPDQQAVRVRPDATLLALGGASWPRLGSDGHWTKWLADAGVPLAPLRPSNCGFLVRWSPGFVERFAGQPLKPVAISHRGVSRQGEAMLTTQGIEGGAIYALSAGIRDAIAAEGSTEITLNLRPTMPLEALQRKFAAPRASKSLSTYLRGLGFSPLVVGLLRELFPADALARADGAQFARWTHALPLTLTDTAPIARVISSAGGIRREALDAHYMLNALPGTFAAGEMLDWEAPTGGYLLQACYSTAVAAARGIETWLGNRT